MLSPTIAASVATPTTSGRLSPPEPTSSAALTRANGTTTTTAAMSKVNSAAVVRLRFRRTSSQRYTGANSSAMMHAHRIVP